MAWCVWTCSPGGKSGASLVLIVDDVDRCAPVVAQKYVTLLRRGLNLPHLAVVLPYTPDQLRYKVFHPLSVDLPDLGSSMEAAHSEMIMGKQGRNDPFGAWATGGRDSILSGLSADFDKLIAKRIEGTVKGSGRNDDAARGESWVEALNTWELLRRERLNQSFIEMVRGDLASDQDAPYHANRLMRQFESKYVSDAPILLPPLGYLDIVQIAMSLPSVNAVVFGGRVDGVVTLLRHIVDTAADDPFRPERANSPRPGFVTEAQLRKLRDDLTFVAHRARSGLGDAQYGRLMNPLKAPSIRTVIAATEYLMQTEAFATALARANALTFPADAFDPGRSAVLVKAFDRIVTASFNFLVE
ncbi:hypothetical protein [Stagnihabitans tardus]|uniref:KAP NTPase domain-containing protein n=1 Tax=Stagnihabitans tardus TaxID=2699202 RepID=A0AAE4YGX4_9RHOB|nr:hypothetical protein [Stagnihabitans tardus]NBZ89939.1 hypothetical protein [Stagnihabitans tardus]